MWHIYVCYVYYTILYIPTHPVPLQREKNPIGASAKFWLFRSNLSLWPTSSCHGQTFGKQTHWQSLLLRETRIQTFLMNFYNCDADQSRHLLWLNLTIKITFNSIVFLTLIITIASVGCWMKCLWVALGGSGRARQSIQVNQIWSVDGPGGAGEPGESRKASTSGEINGSGESIDCRWM